MDHRFAYSGYAFMRWTLDPGAGPPPWELAAGVAKKTWDVHPMISRNVFGPSAQRLDAKQERLLLSDHPVTVDTMTPCVCSNGCAAAAVVAMLQVDA
jgi:hypothetical protein